MEKITASRNCWINCGSHQEMTNVFTALMMDENLDCKVFQTCLKNSGLSEGQSLVFTKSYPPIDLMLSIVESHECNMTCGVHHTTESKISQHCIVLSVDGPEVFAGVKINDSRLSDLIYNNWDVIQDGKMLDSKVKVQKVASKKEEKAMPTQPQVKPNVASLFTKPQQQQQKKPAPVSTEIGAGTLSEYEAKIVVPTNKQDMDTLMRTMVPYYLGGEINTVEDFRKKMLKTLNFFFQKLLPAMIARTNPGKEVDWHAMGVRNRFIRSFIGYGTIDNTVKKLKMTRQMMALAMFDGFMNLRPSVIYEEILADMQNNNNVYLVKESSGRYFDNDKAQKSVEEFIIMKYGHLIGQ